MGEYPSWPSELRVHGAALMHPTSHHAGQHAGVGSDVAAGDTRFRGGEMALLGQRAKECQPSG